MDIKDLFLSGTFILIAWAVFVFMVMKLINKRQLKRLNKNYDPKNDPGLIGRAGLPEDEEKTKPKVLPSFTNDQRDEIIEALKG